MEKTNKISKEVWFTLTEAEIVHRAKEAARIRNEKLLMEVELKDHQKLVKKDIEKKEEELHELMNVVRTGKESRILPCEMEKDFDRHTMKYFYDGKLVDERPLTPDERQMSLSLFSNNGVN